MSAKKVTTATLREMKRKKRSIAMLTAYDYPTACLLDDSGVDVILGHDDTLPVTMEEMLSHAKSVRRGVSSSMIVVDMPFMSYQVSPEAALENAARFIKEAGAQAVKVEGDRYLDAIKSMIKAGIPVMGHLGFTPQLINQIGGYRTAGRSKSDAEAILKASRKLEAAGVFALVLEMVPPLLAKKVARALKVPVIGIGAGPHCDGQVLVTHDMIGLYPRRVPAFVKQYAQVGGQIKKAVSNFVREVQSGKFPGREK